MKQYYKENKTLKQANQYLKKIGLQDFCIDDDYDLKKYGEYEFDGWINDDKTKGVSVRIEKDFTVLVTKYTDKDIRKQEKELDKGENESIDINRLPIRGVDTRRARRPLRAPGAARVRTSR